MHRISFSTQSNGVVEMKLRNPSFVVFCLVIFFSSFATGAEKIASRKTLPIDSAAAVREIAGRNGPLSLFRFPFSRKKSGDSEDASEDETSKTEEEEVIREQDQQIAGAIFQKFQQELPLFASPDSLTTTTTTTPQHVEVDPPAATPSPTVSKVPSPTVSKVPSRSDPPSASPTDIIPSEAIEELSSVAPSSEAAEASEPEEQVAVLSEQSDIEAPVPESVESVDSTESIESVEPVDSSAQTVESVGSWPAPEREVYEEELLVAEPPGSEPAVPVRAVTSAQTLSRTAELSETLSASLDTHEQVEEEDSEAPAPEDNKHRHRIGRKMRIVSWTLASICISLVVVGNFLGIYFSYIRPRLSRRTEYTEL